MTASAPPRGWHERAAALRPETRAFVAGAFVDAADGRTFDDVSPRDGRRVARVARGGAEDVDRAVGAARRTFEAGTWSRCRPAERKRVLLRLAELMDDHREELALLEAVDVGKPISDALSVDVPNAAGCLRWYAEALDKVGGDVAPVGHDALAYVEREPLGVVGAVVPWNYPLIITAWKLAPALAVGNSVVLKPAEQSPLSALRLAGLAAEAGLPDGVLGVVPGLGPEAGAALGRHLDVDKVAFTGSVEVGRRFLRYAGESNGKQVALELGGKSPHVVLADVPDLDACAAAIAWGIFYNAGQTCHAGSRVVAEPAVRHELVARVAELGRSLAPADPLDPGTQVGALVDEAALQRVLRRIDAARADGAELVLGGARAQPVAGGSYVEPTVFDRVDPASALAREEVFGPVLAVLEARDADHAVGLANATEYGLAAAVWTADGRRAARVARALRAGTVWVNTYDAGDYATPFGGMKASGAGRDRSLAALEAYTHAKTTWMALT